MRVLRAGDAALLVETGETSLSHRLHAALTHAALDGVTEVVPAERTVLVQVAPGRCDLAALSSRILSLSLADTAEAAGTVRIPVTYDGADLADVAAATGRTPAEVVALHTGAVYTVAYLGFAPGFGYLTGLPDALHLPRRATPRTSVPAGSVAIAGPYSAVYPAASPGGWHLLGHTPVTLWTTDRTPPALLGPGATVRFTAQEQPA